MLAVLLLLVGAWCRFVLDGCSCVAFGGGLVQGPRGRGCWRGGGVSGMSAVVWLDVLVGGLCWRRWVLLLHCGVWFKVFLPSSMAVCGCGSVESGGCGCGSSRSRLEAGICGFLLPVVVPWRRLAVPVWAASRGVASPLSWCGGGWWCWSLPFLAEGFVGWVAVFGGVSPVLAGCVGAGSCFPWPQFGVIGV